MGAGLGTLGPKRVKPFVDARSHGAATSPGRLRDTARRGATAPPEHGRESLSRPPVVDGRLLAQTTFKTGTRAITSQGRDGRLLLLPSVLFGDAVPAWLHIVARTPGVRATCRRSPLPPTACRCCLQSKVCGWDQREERRRPPRSRCRARPPRKATGCCDPRRRCGSLCRRAGRRWHRGPHAGSRSCKLSVLTAGSVRHFKSLRSIESLPAPRVTTNQSRSTP